ncbi:33709_t:CDS:2, partial [Gigaspora margarita]
LLLSPNGEYAVTWSRNDESICGWRINNQLIRVSVEQSTKELAEQSKNKSYQFELECLMEVGDKCPLTVSNNKYVVIGPIEQAGRIKLKNFGKKDYIGKLNNTISQLEFITFGGEEKLLLIFNNGDLEIRNPYNLQYVINDKISVLYDELLTKGMKLDVQKEEFKRLIDDKIYYVSDELLWVQKVSKEQWNKYLLKDIHKIRNLPIKSVIVDILLKYIGKYESADINQSYNGSLVIWKISNKNIMNVFLKSKFDSNKWAFIDNIELYGDIEVDDVYGITIKLEIYGYELLHDDDLAMITSLGLFIWLIWNKFKKIRLRYFIYWDNKIPLEKRLENLQKHEKDLLPAPDFDFITKNCEKFRSRTKERCYFKELFEERYYFKELLEDYIENDDLLTNLYGHELLKFSLKSKNYEIVEILYNKFFCKTENNNFLKRIHLLEIFIYSFIELIQYHQNLREFLSHTSFIHSTNFIEITEFNKFFSEPHLQNHMKYLPPFFISNI